MMKNRLKSAMTFRFWILTALIVVVALLILTQQVHAVTRTWTGLGDTDACGAGNENNWSCAANWSDNEVPGSGDIARFDATSTKNAIIDVSIDVAGIDIQEGYTTGEGVGTITQAAGVTITVGSSNWVQADGTFAGGNSDISIAGSFTLSGGDFTSTSGTMNIEFNLTIDPTAAFTHNSGTVTFQSSQAGDRTINAPDVTFNKVVVDISFISSSHPTFTIASGTTLPLGDNPTFRFSNTNEPRNGNVVNNGTITVGTGTATFSGQLTPSSTFTNNGTIDLTSADAVVFEVTYVAGAGSTLDIGAATTITLEAGLTVTAGSDTFPQNIDVLFQSSQGGNRTIDAPDVTFNKVVVDISFLSSINSVLTIAEGTTLPLGDNPTFRFSNTNEPRNGNVVNNGTITVGTGTATFSGQLVPSTTFTNNGTITATSADVVIFEVTYIAGAGSTLDIGAATTITIEGGLTVTSGVDTFPQNRTVTFQSSQRGNRTIDAPNVTFNKVVVDISIIDSLHRTFTIAEGTTLPLGDDPTFRFTNANSPRRGDVVNNGTITVGTGTFTVILSSTGPDTFTNNGTVRTQGDTLTLTNAAWVNGADSTIEFIGDGDGAADTFTISNFLSAYENLVINSTDGTLDVFGFGATVTAETCTITSGTFDLAGQALTCATSFTVADGAVLQLQGGETPTTPTLSSGSTVRYNGTAGPYTIKDWDYHHLEIAGSGAVFNLGAPESIAGNFTVSDGTFSANGNTMTVTGLATVSGGTYQASTATQTFNGGLTVSGGVFTGSSGAVDVNGELTLSSGTLTAPTGSFTVSGDWSRTAGTFNHSNATVVFDGLDQTISGATSFFNLTKTLASKVALIFEAGTTTTIEGTFTVTGEADNLVSIVSSVRGTQANLNVTGDHDITFAAVRDINATGNTLTAVNSYDNGNNTNWVFTGSSTSQTSGVRIQGGTTIQGGTRIQ